MEKKLPPIKKSKDEGIIFCTECGEQLEDFCFSQEADSIETLKGHHNVCKKNLKFKGDVCSRIFIAGCDTPETEED
jgi:hypothetical protein